MLINPSFQGTVPSEKRFSILGNIPQRIQCQDLDIIFYSKIRISVVDFSIDCINEWSNTSKFKEEKCGAN
jgi:hypothetical protein